MKLSFNTTLSVLLEFLIKHELVNRDAFFKKPSKKKPYAFYGTGFLMDVFNNEKVQSALTIYQFNFEWGSIVKLNPFFKKAVNIFLSLLDYKRHLKRRSERLDRSSGLFSDMVATSGLSS